MYSNNRPYQCLSTSIFTHDKATDLTIRSLLDFNKNSSPFNYVDNPQKDHIFIENDIWIGQYSTLKAGITIRTDSIVAANSVVTKDVPPYAIVGGNPAKILRYRFNESLINGLLSSK